MMTEQSRTSEAGLRLKIWGVAFMIALRNGLWRRVGAAFVSALLILTAVFGMGTIPRTAEAAGHVFTVYLQAGHSPSALGYGNVKEGVRESVLNEQATIKLYNALKARGINTVLVNPITLDSSLPTIIKQKPAENKQYSYYSPEPAMLTAITWPERFDSSLTDRADMVISLHHNGYHDSSVKGYEIYYASTVGGQYGRTREDVQNSKQLAQYIETEFKKGYHVPARNPAVRDCTTNNAVTKSSPMAAVLVELGYMSNPSDLAACRNEQNQQSTADKIADAVVKYKKSYWPESDYVDIRAKSVEASYAKSDDTVTVTTTLQPTDGVAGATMKVYPQSVGASAEKTYTMPAKGAGKFTARISLEPFGFAPGTYSISIYGVDHEGRSQLSGWTEVEVEPDNALPTASGVTAKLIAATSNAALLTVKDPTAPGGIETVQFAVWSETNGQDDIEWYTATQSGSSWAVTMRTTDLLDRPGKYFVHCYVTDKRGNRQLVGETDVTFDHKEGDVPELHGQLTYRKVGTKLILTATDVRDASGVKGVRFAFWSTAEAQRDMKWYDGKRSGSAWSAVIPMGDHPASDEKYTVHVYGTDENDNDGCIAALDFQLGADTTAPTSGSVDVVEGSDGSATVYVNKVVDDRSGVSSVDVAVWTQKNNQDDLKWYKTARDDTDTWSVKISKASHKNENGPYHIVAYATDAAGNRALTSRTKFTFVGKADKTAPTGGIITTDKNVYAGQGATVTIKDLTDPSGVATVTIEVRSVNGSEKKTYDAVEADGVWTAAFNWGRDFIDGGEYIIRVTATDRAKNTGTVGEKRVVVERTAVDGMQIMGKSQATVAQLANMQLTRGWSNGWYGMTVEEFCRRYYDICEKEGVRAEVAYAQMMHETGSLQFGNLVERYQLNFAGLGSTGNVIAPEKQKSTHRYTSDGRDAGIVFKTVDDGIRSQIQHLKGYASTEPLALPMAAEYDRFGYMERGCAPTIQMLSTKWATDASYGDKVTAYVQEILAQSTKLGTIDTKIPYVIESQQKPAASTSKPGTYSSAVVPAEPAAEEWEEPYQAPTPQDDEPDEAQDAAGEEN